MTHQRNVRVSPLWLSTLLVALSAIGCGSESNADGADLGANDTSASGTGGPLGNGEDFILPSPGTTNLSQSGGSATQGGVSSDCSPNFTGVVRDFQESHPDFEAFSGSGISPGMVSDQLGADSKPVYNTGSPFMKSGAYIHDQYGQQTTSQANFDQWYRTGDWNRELLYTLPLAGQQGRLEFDSSAFFPADGAGFGNEGRNHNFAFTFELHTEFTYTGGELFTFIGDDDLWVFINEKLAVDVGGLHSAETASINLDNAAGRLGLSIGQTYPLSLFHAERHTDHSNFHVETNIQFTNCEPILHTGSDVR